MHQRQQQQEDSTIEVRMKTVGNGKSLAVSNDAQNHFERYVIGIRAAIVTPSNRSAKRTESTHRMSKQESEREGG